MATATPSAVLRSDRSVAVSRRWSGSRLVWSLRALVVVALVGLWQFLAKGALEASVPPPVPVVKELWTMLGEASFYTSLRLTMSSWGIGLLISMVGGVGLGLLIGSVKAVDRSTSWLLDFLRAVPGIALIPLGVLVLGQNAKLTITLIVLVCIWPVLVQTRHAARAIDPMALDVARVTRLGPQQTVRWILFPAMLPYLGTALRLAAVMALMACIGTQLIANIPGLGHDIRDNQIVNNITTLYALVMVVAVLGIVISQGFGWLERKALRWHPSEAGTAT
jgi:NitT/TauT family transport system permease protein